MMYDIFPFPPVRKLLSENIRGARFKNNIHLFIEADVTALYELAGARNAQSGDFSIPVFCLVCFARLLRRHPELVSRRSGNRVVRFRQADIMTIVERTLPGQAPIPMAILIRDAGNKRYAELLDEIRRAQQVDPLAIPEVARRRKLMKYPAWLIRLILGHIRRDPVLYGKYFGNAGFTSLHSGKSERFSMAVPVTTSTLTLLVNTTSRKVVQTPEGLAERLFKGFTFVADHDLIDGAQGMRYAEEFCRMIESPTSYEDET